MSLVLSNNKQKLDARYSITFLSTFSTNSIHHNINNISKTHFFPEEVNFILILVFGILMGNILIKLLSENKYKLLINFLVITSSVILFFS